MEAKLSKIHEMQQKRSKREVYGDTGLSQETRKISNKKLNLQSKATRERRTNRAQS